MGKLIRLELFNFKSYKGHHVLLFGDSYFTSIIGPNGSGKSNSMDAISFVLGIKSSHLRSTQLRDLVYRGRVLRTSKIGVDGNVETAETNGTNGHVNGQEPEADGAGDGEDMGSQRNDPQTAWVMAVYLDDNGNEQKWKRSITSSGQSDYRINNRAVSAKQYNEALEAENILIKARNFLVFQGDVEAIANQNPRDLTRLIEQISGSLDYRADYDRLRDEAEKANEELGFKLNVRRGMNAEIRQYQEQKREAESYQHKVDERDGAIVTHMLWKLFHFQKAIEQSGAEIQRHQEELKEFRRNVEQFEEKLEEAKLDQSKASRDCSKVERSIRRKEKDLEELENSLVPIHEKTSISQGNVEKFTARIAEITKERDSQTKTIDRLKKDLDVVQKAQQRWENEWRATQQQQGRELSESDLQEYNRLKSEVMKRTSEDQTRVNDLMRQLKTNEETVNNLKSKVDVCQTQSDRLSSEIDGIKERRDELTAQVKTSQKEIDEKKKEFNKMNSERLRSQQMHDELNEKLREVLVKLSEAEGGRRESEKEVRSREIISQMRHIFPGVRGRVHELCKPKQKKYESAVSTVLGRHFDSVVVDGEKTAKDCIQYLREQRLGQATFIPLDTIMHQAPDSALRGLHRGMRLAIDTIEYDQAVERAMNYACGNAMVCDDLEVAKDLCYRRRVDAKAVTLDGTVIHKGGLMTGGRGPNDQKNARKWEDAEVENLRRLRDKLLADLQTIAKAHRRGTEEEAVQGQLAGLEQRVAYLKEEVKSSDRSLDSKKREHSFVAGQLKEAKPKYDEQDKALNGLKKSLEKVREKVAAVEDQIYSAFTQRLGFSDIRQYEAQQGSLQQEAAQNKLEFTTQRSRLENQLTFETQRLTSTKDRLKTLQEQMRRDDGLVKQLAKEKKTIKNEIDVAQAEIEQLTEELEQFKQVYQEKITQVQDARQQVHKRTKTVEATLRTVTGLEAEIARNNASRYGTLRRCKMEEIKVPLLQGSEKLESLPLDDVQGPDEDAMDLDEPATQNAPQVQDYGIELNFERLDDDLKEDDSEAQETSLKEAISNLETELSHMAPNMRANERLDSVQARIQNTEREYDQARRAAKRAKDDFDDIRSNRFESFMKAFSHISEKIDPIYKDLTRSTSFPLGGQAYLDLEDNEEPFLHGIKYHAMPPLKRFRDMEHLSGGEKTMAALALLFAIHSYQPSPFFVLDEVDAALDAANVAKVAQYVREHAGPGMQFVVISLKNGLYEKSETLVGIMRDQGINSSKALTLDLRKYLPDQPEAETIAA